MRVISDTYPVARKEHRCFFCGGKISKGEKYHRQVAVDDVIDSTLTHLDCDKVATELRMWDDCDEGLSSDDFYCNLSDYLYEHFPKEKAQELRERKINDIVQTVLTDLNKKTQDHVRNL